MKREIKFRAWNSLKNRMVITDFHITCFGIAWKHDDDFDMDNYYTVMQFTGLKDRNGIEIYEGDILKCDFSRDNNGLHDSIQLVEFYEGSFGSRNKNDHFRIPALFSGRATEGMNLNYYEVIGNIYQNPELLK